MKTTTSLHLDDDVIAWLDREAQQQDRSRSWVANNLIKKAKKSAPFRGKAIRAHATHSAAGVQA